jgi:hypothetical protein
MNDMPFGPSRGPAPLQGPAASLQAPSRVPP